MEPYNYREALDRMVVNFLETIGNLEAIEGKPEETASAIEFIGKRLRDECCAGELRGHAQLAKMILDIATMPN